LEVGHFGNSGMGMWLRREDPLQRRRDQRGVGLADGFDYGQGAVEVD
jgi:hypothetical protein